MHVRQWWFENQALYFLSGQVHPDCWIISVAAQIPQSTHSLMDLPLANWAKNPPTNASPAPLVSIILSSDKVTTCKKSKTKLYYLIIIGFLFSRNLFDFFFSVKSNIPAYRMLGGLAIFNDYDWIFALGYDHNSGSRKRGFTR